MRITQIDGFVCEAHTKHLAIHEAIHGALDAEMRSSGRTYIQREEVLKVVQHILNSTSIDAGELMEAVMARLAKIRSIGGYNYYTYEGGYQIFLDGFLSQLAFESKEALELFFLRFANGVKEYGVIQKVNWYQSVKLLKDYFNTGSLPTPIKTFLEDLYQDYILPIPTKRYTSEWRVVSDWLGLNDPIELFQSKLDEEFGASELEQKLTGDYPVFTNSPYKAAEEVIEALIAAKSQSLASAYGQWVVNQKLKLEDIVDCKDLAIVSLRRIAFEKYNLSSKKDVELYQIEELFGHLVKEELILTEKEILFVYQGFKEGLFLLRSIDLPAFYDSVEVYIKKEGLTETLRLVIADYYGANLQESYYPNTLGKMMRKKRKLLRGKSLDAVNLVLFFNKADDFGRHIQDTLPKEPQAQEWYEILEQANTAKGGKPSQQFQAGIEEVLVKTTLSDEEIIKQLNDWFGFIVKMGNEAFNEHYTYFIQFNNANTLKGLIWMIQSIDHKKALYNNLYRLAIRCYAKIPGKGPAAAGVGNACVFAFFNANDLEAVACLTKLRLKVKQKNTRSLIAKYIEQAAEQLGVTPSMIEDMSIPDYGLKDGLIVHAFEDYNLKIQIERVGKVSQQWVRPNGKAQKSVPAFVKKDFAERFKKIKKDIKEIQQMLTVQRDRMDRSYVHDVSWTMDSFNAFYVNHGLMSFLTKKLIWVFEEGEERHSVFWQDAWKGVDGQEIVLSKDTIIKLWHPVMVETEEVLQWREFMQEHQIVQPLKQAYRELYVLTDAELNTRFYSNRMAAHIIKQHQFNVLATVRNWKYSLMGAYDDGISGTIASIDLSAHRIRAEFWVDELQDFESVNDAGIWLYVSTDQVRFEPYEGEVLNLIDVPKLVFSEVMRDVDLFVGVGSVGNDPQWQDNAGNQRHHNYWQSYSFGNLTEVAKTRKTILERLLPKLAIANIAEIEGKFLKVKGKFTTYKIHIGSTNILMEPDDRYLCIVPSRKKDTRVEKVFLPFEGDRGFSILLSKAFMLAKDDKITDPTIISQLPKE